MSKEEKIEYLASLVKELCEITNSDDEDIDKQIFQMQLVVDTYKKVKGLNKGSDSNGHNKE